jgi:dTDP-4-dehydrorhamnose reductase
MLGRDLVERIRAAGIEVTALARPQLDITDADAVRAAVRGHDLVINAAAWTDVDGAETAEEQATAVNGHGVANLAAACAQTGARLVTISTDYVFDGTASEPYAEDAPTDPINAYGRSKLVGEHAIRDLLPEAGYIVRTAWLYGAYGANFVRTVLRLAEQRETIDVVTDQVGQPTWTRQLAERLVELGTAALAGSAPPGIYHGTASGATSWYGLARAAYAATGLDPDRVRPTTSAAFPRPARRPAYSVLRHDAWSRAGLAPMPDWHDMLTQALADPDLIASWKTDS